MRRKDCKNITANATWVAPAPRAQVLAAGHGYVSFARENPGLFHMIFSGPAYAYDRHELERRASEAYDVLRQISAPFEPGTAGDEGI